MADEILLDWVSFTIYIETDLDLMNSIDSLAFFLGEETSPEISNKSGLRGYSHGFRVLDNLGYAGFHPDRLENGLHVSLSGQALSLFRSRFSVISPVEFLKSVLLLSPVRASQNRSDDDTVRFTRLDFAFDDKSGLLDLEEIERICIARNSDPSVMTTRFRQCKPVKELWQLNGYTLYFGSRSSDTYARLYDKASEQGLHNEHWVRFELVIKGDRATPFAKQLISDGLLFVSESILAYLDFHSDWWNEFLDTKKKSFLSLPRSLRSVRDKIEWLYNQVCPSLAVIDRSVGLDLIGRLIASGHTRLSERDEAAIKRYFLSESDDSSSLARWIKINLSEDDIEADKDWSDYTERLRYSQRIRKEYHPTELEKSQYSGQAKTVQIVPGGYRWHFEGISFIIEDVDRPFSVEF